MTNLIYLKPFSMSAVKLKVDYFTGKQTSYIHFSSLDKNYYK